METKTEIQILNNFDLKKCEIQMKQVSKETKLSLNELELLRHSDEKISSSKNGLEEICGLSSGVGSM